MPPRREPMPSQALAWLLGEPRDVLLLGPTSPLVSMLTAYGHTVTPCHPDIELLRRLQGGQPGTGHPLCARPDALPVRPHRFRGILVPQLLHELPPRSYAQLARVLAPGGTLAVTYTTRDDTVPWVRRLAALLQAVDPGAMQGGYGTDSVERLRGSHYFPHLAQESFRTWVPISRAGLARMVAQRPVIAGLPADRREELLADVAAFYDSLARGPEPLLLPYQTECWRAEVCHDEMSIPLTLEEGLRLLQRLG